MTQQILLSTPAAASGEFHRAWSSNEDWQRVQITADQCPRISPEHLAAERIRLGDALYRQELLRCSRAQDWGFQSESGQSCVQQLQQQAARQDHSQIVLATTISGIDSPNNQLLFSYQNNVAIFSHQ